MQLHLSGKTLDEIAIERIRAHEPPDGYWVGDSGGKDSSVVLDLVRRSGVKYEAHYSPTTIDPPEVVRFIKRHHPETVFDKVEMSMWACIRQNGIMPTKWARFCCRVFKEIGGSGRVTITGLRWSESNARAKRRMTESCVKQSKTILNPIIDWRDCDVWDYIHDRNVPYCKLYDEGFKRLGCVLCPLKSSRLREKDLTRWPGISARWKASARYCWDNNPKLHDKNESFDAYWQWWITRATKEAAPIFD